LQTISQEPRTQATRARGKSTKAAQRAKREVGRVKRIREGQAIERVGDERREVLDRAYKVRFRPGKSERRARQWN